MSEQSSTQKSALEKVFLAGIGALALTGEKTKEMLEELIERGELTVEQGKALNEELKHTINKNRPGADSAKKADLFSGLDKLSKEELVLLRRRLDELEAQGGDKNTRTEG